MRILAAGGGSGGHVTPVVAVLRELKSRNDQAELRFWCDRKFAPKAKQIMARFDDSIPVEVVFAGKFRRYHNVSVFRQLTYPPIVLRNLRDIFLVIAGFIQSLVKLIIWRPDVVFTKGGYVCLPIGLAARLLRIPLVIHDSDAHPGLTNRVLARFATGIATGAPLKFYPYRKDRSRYVGIPVSDEFKPFSYQQRYQAKQELGVDPTSPLVVITGGGLGAKRINDAVVSNVEQLTAVASVILISGTDQYEELKQILPQGDPRLQLHGFVSGRMALMLGAADLVVARAGATTILELAALAKPTVLIPNGLLTGGHQLKNAAVYHEKNAVALIDESDLVDDSQVLHREIVSLLGDQARLQAMSEAFAQFAKPNAAAEVANMITAAAKT